MALLSGCFVQLQGGIAPSAHETVTPTSGPPMDVTSRAWTLGVYVGLYLDLGNIGVSYSIPNLGGYGYYPHGDDLPVTGIGGSAQHLRLDADIRRLANLPMGQLVLRGTLEGDWITRANVRVPANEGFEGTDGSGVNVFAGATAGVRRTLDLSLGVAYETISADASDKLPAVDADALSFQVHLTYFFSPWHFIQIFKYAPDLTWPTMGGRVAYCVEDEYHSQRCY